MVDHIKEVKWGLVIKKTCCSYEGPKFSHQMEANNYF